MNWFVTATGFGISLGLIAAIGAQNAHVLRQGIAGRQVAISVAICIICDTVLMASGVYGMGAMIAFWPPFESVTRIGGGLFLLVFGGICFRSAFKNQSLGVEGRVVESFWSAFWTILGVTLLNPHVYLDTLIFVGGIGAQYGPDHQLSLIHI